MIRLAMVPAGRAPRALVLAVCLAVFGASARPPAAGADPAPSTPWPMFGQNLANTASGLATKIGTATVGTLTPKWSFTTGGDVSARPAVANGAVYFPDWAGSFSQLDATNGKLVWAKDIATDYLGGALGSLVVSRTSPFLDTGTNTVYIGTQTGAYLLAIDATTGALKWKTQLDAHPLAIDTQSPVEVDGAVYVGVASSEEGAPSSKNMFALDAASGSILWSFAAGGSVNAGAVVTEHIVYWGSGYGHLGPAVGTPNNTFYAFVLGGE